MTFAAAKLPAGASTAVMTASDAAGNKTTRSFQLSIDGKPPVVSILSPTTGSIAQGTVDVELAASDAEGGPVWIEVSCGGGPPSTVPGPQATVVFHTDDYAKGSLEIEAVAVDEAGNRSAPSAIALLIQ